MPELQGLLTRTIKETQCDTGWAPLATVGTFIGKSNASFAVRNYGLSTLSKLSELMRRQPYIEVKEVPDAAGFVHFQVRPKP